MNSSAIFKNLEAELFDKLPRVTAYWSKAK